VPVLLISSVSNGFHYCYIGEIFVGSFSNEFVSTINENPIPMTDEKPQYARLNNMLNGCALSHYCTFAGEFGKRFAQIRHKM
jgi:hypothetical protein